MEHEVNGAWIRVELQTRDVRAARMAQAIRDEGMAAVPGVIRACLDFKLKGRGERKCRWTTLQSWEHFLGGVEKLSLAGTRLPPTEKRDIRTALRAAPAMARLVQTYGTVLVDELLEDGRRRI